MELKEAIEKLANESVEYADIAENVLEGKGKVAEDCREYVEAIRVVLNHLTKQEKMIELIEKECRQRLAFAKRIRRSEKRNPDDFNQGLEFESATIMNLLSGEPHWEYEGKYFDDIDKQVEKLKAEEIE
ncbi:MAG: hypothetical protein IIZ67_04800 [Bacilli bacterium]|nr:hypothetical protein [Bacilli bacterium]